MFSYECWKCPEQHATDLGGAIAATKYANALVYLTIAGRTFPVMPAWLFNRWKDRQSQALSNRYQR